MSHFLGTPARSHIWQSHGSSKMHETKNLRKRLLSGATVDVYIGPDRKRWSLHKNLLAHHSSYFESELQGHEDPKSKAGGSTLELPDDDPRGFELLVKWLYQGQLEDVSQSTDEERYEHAVACHKLYQLCDKFDMVALKNLAMDSYRSDLHAAQLVPDADEINEIYRASDAGSPFRLLMIEIAARQIMDPDVERDMESYRCCFEGNADFAVDLVTAIRSMSGGTLFEDPTNGDDCSWHDHPGGSSCRGGMKAMLQMNGKGPSKIMKTPGGQKARPPMNVELSPEQSNPKTLKPAIALSPKKRKAPANASDLANSVPSTPKKSLHVSFQSPSSSAKRKRTMKHPIEAPFLSGVSPQHIRAANERRKLLPSPEKLSNSDSQSTTNEIKVIDSPKKGPSAVPNGSPRKPRNTSTMPRKVGHVNGIVRHLNGLDGAMSDDGSSDKGNRRPPPKLKRQVPE